MKSVTAVLVSMALVLWACGGHKRIAGVSDQSESPTMGSVKAHNSDRGSGFPKHTRFKKISPDMEFELEDLIKKGCVPDYKILDNETAYLYSIIPGGGQIYTGETKKALMYLMGSILIVPYLVSFEDAQSTVDYINAKYSIDYCKKKLRLAHHKEIRVKNKKFLGKTLPDANLKKRNREFMDQLMRENR